MVDYDIRSDAPAKPMPAHYGDLTAVRLEAFNLLTRGARDRRSAFHTPVLVTNGLDGYPAARTVVLREFDVQHRSFIIHTDVRSAKTVELKADERAVVVFYDAQKKIQIRVKGRCQIHHQDDVSRSAWQRLAAISRRCYLGQPPGTATDRPSSGLPANFATRAPTDEEAAEGLDNFVVLSVRMFELDWLFLAAAGHRRARITWEPGGEAATWLHP